jgi:hypothetical protein
VSLRRLENWEAHMVEFCKKLHAMAGKIPAKEEERHLQDTGLEKQSLTRQPINVHGDQSS